jgi:hypothetical protein
MKCAHAKLTLLALSSQTSTTRTRWSSAVSSCRRFQAEMLCYVGHLELFSFTAVDTPTSEIRRNGQRLSNCEGTHIWYSHRDGYSTVSNRIYFFQFHLLLLPFLWLTCTVYSHIHVCFKMLPCYPLLPYTSFRVCSIRVHLSNLVYRTLPCFLLIKSIGNSDWYSYSIH